MNKGRNNTTDRQTDYAKLKYLNIPKLLCLGQHLVQRWDDCFLIPTHSSVRDFWMAKEPGRVSGIFHYNGWVILSFFSPNQNT